MVVDLNWKVGTEVDMGDISLLQAPRVPVEMKVFHGGALPTGGNQIGGVVADSLLPQPEGRIPMMEFKGGGRKDVDNVKEREESKEELLDQKGGAFIEDNNINNYLYQFRGISEVNNYTPFKDNIVILKVIELNSDEYKSLKKNPKNFKQVKINDITILPVVVKSQNIFYIKEDNINYDNKNFISENGKIITKEEIQEYLAKGGRNKYYYPLIIVLGEETVLKGVGENEFLKLLAPAGIIRGEAAAEARKSLLGVSAQSSPKGSEEPILSEPSPEIESEKTDQSACSSDEPPYMVGVLTTVVGGVFRVRYIDEEKKDLTRNIKNLIFTPDEQKLFSTVLNMNKEFICNHIKSDTQYTKDPNSPKNKFYKFWKLFVNLDAMSGLTLATSEEGEEIQNYLREINDLYRQYLQDKSLKYLRKQNGYIGFTRIPVNAPVLAAKAPPAPSVAQAAPSAAAQAASVKPSEAPAAPPAPSGAQTASPASTDQTGTPATPVNPSEAPAAPPASSASQAVPLQGPTEEQILAAGGGTGLMLGRGGRRKFAKTRKQSQLNKSNNNPFYTRRKASNP